MALNYAKNILVTFRCHAPPIRFGNLPVSQARYIANELDGLVGGENTAIVIGVWSHFSTFPVEVYIRRLLSIRRAVERLLTRAPGTLVIIRTANPKALSLYETLTNSDWFSIQRDKILRTIFKGVNVRFVDAWEMTLAHYLPHNLHPQRPIITIPLHKLVADIPGTKHKNSSGKPLNEVYIPQCEESSEDLKASELKGWSCALVYTYADFSKPLIEKTDVS
ncbi:PREDICTED: NXPE family member 3-like [Poecilia mexicana]|uniref:NXPE family member 3-like n=1 Tax=Poecilia mexicana TaxID=48701 RepID=UPI00072DCE38|nr:PREDICTED: NXPE family member 3-like [Poecilia mexicana]